MPKIDGSDAERGLQLSRSNVVSAGFPKHNWDRYRLYEERIERHTGFLELANLKFELSGTGVPRDLVALTKGGCVGFLATTAHNH